MAKLVTLGYTLGGDETTADDYLIYRIYNYGILYHTTGSAISDPDVSVSTGVATIENIVVDADTTYSFTVAEVDQAGNEGNQSNAKIITISEEVGAGSTPILFNFRTDNSWRYRVYFDSSELISATTFTGFTITDKTISNIYIRAGYTTGHYFTVNEIFNYWDNNTIRYEGGSDIKDVDNNNLHNFKLQYIENNITEPTRSGRTIFVSLTGNDTTGDGSSGLPYRTLVKGSSEITQPGDALYIEKGDYGDDPITITVSGEIDNPIKILGYNLTPNDEPTLDRTPTTVLDGSNMPYINTVSTSGTGINISNKDYIILKNVSVKGYDSSIDFRGSEYTHFESVYVEGGNTWNFNSFNYTGLQQRLLKCYSLNGKGFAINIAGGRHLIDDMYACTNADVNLDYYISLYGGNISGAGEHIVRNSHIEASLLDSHSGHGISLKASGRAIERTLVEDCTINNVRTGAIELRHSQIQHNVIRNVTATWDGQDETTYGGIRVTSAQNNAIENSRFDSEYAVWFHGSTEDSAGLDAGNNNVFSNCIFGNTTKAFVYHSEDSDGQNRVPNNNSFINCTFSGSTNMFHQVANEVGTGNKFINCIVEDVTNKFLTNNASSQTGWTFEYTDTWDFWGTNGVAESGTGNISVDPNFTVDFTPQNTNLKVGTITDVKYDADGTERDATNPTMGAKEKL